MLRGGAQRLRVCCAPCCAPATGLKVRSLRGDLAGDWRGTVGGTESRDLIMGLLGIEAGIPGGVSGTMSPWVFWPLLIMVAGIGWALLIAHRPLVLCTHCDNGKDWDPAREHFGLRCDGWGRLWCRIGTCHGAGRKLRWEIRVLRCLGIGRRIPDPVAKARGR